MMLNAKQIEWNNNNIKRKVNWEKHKKSKLKIETEMDMNESVRGTNNNGVVHVYRETHTQSKN